MMLFPLIVFVSLLKTLFLQSIEHLHFTSIPSFNVGVLIPSTDGIIANLAIHSLNSRSVILPPKELLHPHSQSDVKWIWRHMLVESKVKFDSGRIRSHLTYNLVLSIISLHGIQVHFCVSSIDYVDVLRPIVGSLSIPLLVLLPGCSKIVSDGRWGELRKAGPRALESYIMKGYATLRDEAKRLVLSHRESIKTSKFSHYCKTTVPTDSTNGIYIFSNGLLPRESPHRFFMDSTMVAFNAQRFIRTLQIQPSDHLFSCLPHHHPGTLIDASRVRVT